MNSEFTIAVHSLVYLAYLPDHMASSQSIAHNVATNPVRVRKIMSCLREAGFVKTKEGTGGGYTLTADPKDITLGQVYRSVSFGAIKPTWCKGEREKSCLISTNIQEVVNGIFLEADQFFAEYLDKTTIKSVLNQIRGKTE
ncbi:Rrf2 family transcriptional regulator [Rossellomorea vietnamensis]|uniref:Rrf2 family transcriptional regulator n=2 Tax=Rossellomorea TaxID=2837508 RepID=A0A5D4KBW7_9BACI|nr:MULTISPECIES: Rrf2 family transcriptional regulator [Rossellomorea]TYR74260.1 Rrf2 family transcriptional regulator [Rossellomorea vietnamensis]TYS79953.1 Rrf2 family transcriptional regulator [Rossellomorea aquimaris]